MKTKEELLDMKSFSTTLRNPKTTTEEVEGMINEINLYFQELTEVYKKEGTLDTLAAMPSKAGAALSLNHAAECLIDYKRTVKFLRGFVAAIKDKQKEYPKEVIEIFYAGCGPYAPFITMVAPLFTSNEVQFSLLEINEKSLESAKKLIQKLELTSYVKAYHLADAITFEIPNPEKIHILFSETLDALLYRECYVPILWNLLPQLAEDVIVIPENVSVKLNFKKATEEEIFAETIFDTRKVLKENKKTDVIPEQLPAAVVALNEASQYKSIILDTDVQIYKNEKLLRGESSLSLALEMKIEKPIIHKAVIFTYQLQPKIELKLAMQ